MKSVFISHSYDFDYKTELYEPLQKLEGIALVLSPTDSTESTKEIIKNSDFLIAEVSSKSNGVGIEIGWADAFDVPVIFIYKKGTKVSRSLVVISDKFIEYETVEEILPKLAEVLK